MAELMADLPPAVYRAVCCDVCGEPLVRTETAWTCRKVLGHQPLIGDLGILERVDPVLPGDLTPAGTIKGKKASGRAMQLRRVLKQLTALSHTGHLPRMGGGGQTKGEDLR